MDQEEGVEGGIRVLQFTVYICKKCAIQWSIENLHFQVDGDM